MKPYERPVTVDEPSLEIARCCADFYAQPWVAELIGTSFHPGGLPLSRRSFEQLRLPPGSRVLDLACGQGTTAIELCNRYDVAVVGVDFSLENLDRARARGREALVDGRLEFVHGRADELPFDDACFDAVLCECAVSTFPDKPRVAAEMFRVAREGGQIAISDVVVERELPSELSQAIGPWACVHQALTSEGYRSLFADAGARLGESHDESSTLLELEASLKRRLLVVGLGQISGAIGNVEFDLAGVRTLLARGRESVTSGDLQYWRFCFSRGVARRAVAPAFRAGASCDPSTGCCG